MAHPFFDSPTYPWHRADAQELHRQLYSAYAAAGRIELLYQSAGGPYPPLAAGASIDMWRDALNTIAIAQQLRELRDRLRAEIPPAPKVVDAFAAIENAIDPIDRPGLMSNRVIVDRRSLRDALERMSKTPTSVPVLIVRGDEQSGKTWTRFVVEEQAQAIGADIIYFGEGHIATAEHVVDWIFATLGASSPAVMTTPTAWYMRCCQDMLRAATMRGKQLWIVADDLGSKSGVPRLDDEVRRFFEQLALSMQTGTFANWFRLVLIDYPDGPVPTRWGPFWTEDRTRIDAVTEDDVAEFLTRWADYKRVTLLPEVARQQATQIIAELSAPGADQSRSRLQRLHDALNTAVHQMVRP